MTTFGPWAVCWLDAVAHRVRPQTLSNYRTSMTLHWIPLLGDLPLHAIRRSHVRAAMRTLLTTRAAGSVRSDLRVLGACFEDAVDDELIPSNPTRNAGRGVLPKRQQGRVALTHDQLTRVLLACRRDAELSEYVLLLSLLGIRAGELLGLRWDDLDLPGRAMTVARTRTKRGVGPTKSGRVSVVEIPDFAAEILAWRHEEQRGSTWVFEGPTGHPRPYLWCWRRFSALMDDAGLPDITLHHLRHTYGTNLLAVADVSDVQRQLTHASVQTTVDVYAAARRHSVLPALNRVADPLRRLVRQPALRRAG